MLPKKEKKKIFIFFICIKLVLKRVSSCDFVRPEAWTLRRRLFYHAPPYAILDEATSAINPDEEHLLYERVIAQGTTVVSIAHRLELRRFHKRELRVKGDGAGSW